jgi:hypothetical protein
MLSAMIGEAVDEATVLQKPELKGLLISTQINRPELSLFEAQNSVLDIQKNAIQTKNMPHVGLFLQGGYSQPGLNMLNGGFEPYYGRKCSYWQTEQL